MVAFVSLLFAPVATQQSGPPPIRYCPYPSRKSLPRMSSERFLLGRRRAPKRESRPNWLIGSAGFDLSISFCRVELSTAGCGCVSVRFVV